MWFGSCGQWLLGLHKTQKETVLEVQLACPVMGFGGSCATGVGCAPVVGWLDAQPIDVLASGGCTATARGDPHMHTQKAHHTHPAHTRERRDS